jgi:hypothetical protein
MTSQPPSEPARDPLATISIEDFEQRLGDCFRVASYSGDDSADEPLFLTLDGVKPAATDGQTPESRQPFSLLFRSGPNDLYLAQSTYALEHEELGTLPMLLFPLDPDERGMRYEAAFS